MQHKAVPVVGVKTSGLPEGQFTGWGAVFDNVDAHGDVIRRGAFDQSIKSGQVTPLLWEHQASDPRSYVGEILDAKETDEGLQITGQFDLDSEFGQAAYRAVKSRRVTGLSIGYRVRNSTKNAAGVTELTDIDLAEISVVSRPANDRALITATKSVERRESLRDAIALAQIQTKAGKNMTEDRFHEERTALLTKAREIAEVAKELDRDLTDTEATEIKSLMSKADEAKAMSEGAARSEAVFSALNAMAASGSHSPAASTTGLTGDRLAFTKATADKLTAKILGENGEKAIAPSGSAITGQEFQADPVALGRPALSLLQILPVTRHSSPNFAYLRQNVRDNKAAIVPEGTVKPTSVFSVERVEAALAVIAHLSEGLPKYWLEDAPAVSAWLTSELTTGLAAAVEAMALATINATSGVQTNAYATSALATLRTSVTKLELQGLTPAAFIVGPNSWQQIELAVSSTNAVEHLGLPYDPATRRLFGVPVVVSNIQAADTAHTLATGSVGLDTDTSGVSVSWSENSNSDDWSKNLIRARVEGRYAASVFQPLGVVKSALK
jgi:HK97 family phage prohead protease